MKREKSTNHLKKVPKLPSLPRQPHPQEVKNVHDNAVEARPSKPFEGGKPGEYEVLMAQFGMAIVDLNHPSRAKMLELSHWFGGPAKNIIDTYLIWTNADVAYGLVKLELDTIFKCSTEAIMYLIDTVRSGKQIKAGDLKAHLDFYSTLSQTPPFCQNLTSQYLKI